MLPNQRCTCLARAFMPSQTPAAALLHHAHSVMTGNNTYFWPKTESREKCYLSSFPCRSEDASSLTASSFPICYWYFGTFKTWIATCIPVPAESSPFERSFFYLSRTNAEETKFFPVLVHVWSVQIFVITHPILFPSGSSLPPFSWERCVTCQWAPLESQKQGKLRRC